MSVTSGLNEVSFYLDEINSKVNENNGRFVVTYLYNIFILIILDII